VRTGGQAIPPPAAGPASSFPRQRAHTSGVRLGFGFGASLVIHPASRQPSGAPTSVSRAVPSLASVMRMSSPLAARSISSSRLSLAWVSETSSIFFLAGEVAVASSYHKGADVGLRVRSRPHGDASRCLFRPQKRTCVAQAPRPLRQFTKVDQVLAITWLVVLLPAAKLRPLHERPRRVFVRPFSRLRPYWRPQ